MPTKVTPVHVLAHVVRRTVILLASLTLVPTSIVIASAVWLNISMSFLGLAIGPVVVTGCILPSVIIVLSMLALMLPAVVVLAHLLETCFLSKLLSHVVELIRFAVDFVWAVSLSMLACTDAAVHRFRPGRFVLAEHLALNILIIVRLAVVAVID